MAVWWEHGVEGMELAGVEGSLSLPVPAPEEQYDECEDERASNSANYSADDCADAELLGTFCVDRIYLNVDVRQAIITVARYWYSALRHSRINTNPKARMPNAAPWIALCKACQFH
jgi:hypothetical protein